MSRPAKSGEAARQRSIRLADKKWTVYYKKDQALNRIKIKAESFNEAMDAAREKLPAGTEIVDCEPVGERK